MPYILSSRREQVFEEGPECKGDLTYMISMIMHQYVIEQGLNYQNLSDAVAACTDAAADFTRTVKDPYENRKMKLNGHLSKLDEFYLKESE